MKVCIICEADVAGKAARPVKEDHVIRAIRSLKGALKIARNNELYVCGDCQQTHRERRKEFEKMLLYAAIFAAIILLLLLGRLLLSGAFDVIALVSAFVLAFFVMSLPLFKYVPASEEQATDVPGKAPEPGEEKGPRPKGRKKGG